MRISDWSSDVCSSDLYHRSLGGKPAPMIDGTTGDQRFYEGWAQVWRTKYREPALRSQLLANPHSPGEQRAATVRNLDPWYKAFNVKPGRSEEHTSALQSLMRISYAVFCLKKKKTTTKSQEV